MGGFKVIAEGIGQSFLNSNKFPNIFPAPGHGVPAQVGILLGGWGLLSGVLSCGGFSFSEFNGALGVCCGQLHGHIVGLGDGFGFGYNSCLISLCGDEFPLFISHLCFFSHNGVGIGLARTRLIWLGLKFWTQWKCMM